MLNKTPVTCLDGRRDAVVSFPLVCSSNEFSPIGHFGPNTNSLKTRKESPEFCNRFTRTQFLPETLAHSLIELTANTWRGSAEHQNLTEVHYLPIGRRESFP